MSRSVSNQSWILFPIFGIIGLLGLLFHRRAKSPQATIRRILEPLGFSPKMIRYWTAISAFETAVDGKPWNSRVLRDSNNLFNLIVPGKPRLQYGEGQTIYQDPAESVEDLYLRVMKPFKYPLEVETLTDLVNYMKSKNYFTSALQPYQDGAHYWYRKLYPGL